jgi:hypothetical protein
MKILVEIDLHARLTPEEIDAFRKQCEEDGVLPEQKIAKLIRMELNKDPEKQTA